MVVMGQIAGFAAVFVLFLACGVAFYPLTSSAQALQGFQAMYYISSVFAQFVNATTFLLVGQLPICCLMLFLSQEQERGL